MHNALEKFLEAFRSGEINGFVNILTGDEIKNFLVEVNRQVRGLNPEEGGIYKGDRMIVGECISPKGEIQERYFDKIVDFFKGVNNKEDMAIGMYYLINYLHLFQDGNGRTSRFVYELMTNNDFKDFDGKFFRHEQGKSSSGSGFCEQKGIKEIRDAKKYSGYALYQYLTAMHLLPDSLKDFDLYRAYTFLPCSDIDSVYISDKALNEGILTSEVRFSQ